MTVEVIDGSRTSFGPKEAEARAPAEIPTSTIKEMRVPIQWDKLDLVSSEFDATVQSLPAHAWIKDATLRVTEVFTSAGATTLDIGLAQLDGTVIDLDGIDAVIAKTAIDAVGETVLCNGALVGNTAGIGANEAQITTNTLVGPYTAGKATLIIRYIELPV